MADQRSVLNEYRFLDEKRRTQGLTRDEDVRLGTLRDVVGEAAPAGPNPGFDVAAAAARLRESLLPAGLRQPSPAAPEAVAFELDPDPEPTAPVPSPAAFAFESAAFHPAPLAPEPTPDSEPPWDPNDPNAQAWEAALAAYDPNTAAPEPDAIAVEEPYAADVAPAVYDADATGWDPSAASRDPNGLPAESAEWDPIAPPEATAWLPAVEEVVVEEAAAAPALGEYDALAPGTAVPTDADFEALLPFDAAAASAIGLLDLQNGFDGPRDAAADGVYDDPAPYEANPAAWGEPELVVEPEAEPVAAPEPVAEQLAEPQPEPEPFETAAQLVADAASDWHLDTVLENGFELASHGSFETVPADPEPAPAASEVELEPALETTLFDAPEPSVEVELPPEEFADPTAAPEAAPALAADPELPTLEGEDLLVELLPEPVQPEPEPVAHVEPVAALEPVEPLALPPLPLPESEVTAPLAVAPEPWPEPAPPAGPPRLDGPHRVVVHTVEGHVQRGVVEDLELGAPSFTLGGGPGTPAIVETDRVKAIFFMLAPGERGPVPEGQRVRVTFRDGRQVTGYSPDYQEGAAGFFMIPVETRTNTGRIWVYATAVKAVAVVG